MVQIQQQPEPIAVVGSACRFPGGSDSPSRLWDLLRNPHDVSTEIPDDRFQLKGYYHPKGAHHGTTNVQRAYMLEQDVRLFDAGFFNISPNEADATDPQQRLLLEVVYEALEAGGHATEKLRGSDTAVYVGTMSVDYNDMILRDLESLPTYFSTGSSRAILANRVSYFFDWHGPSMTIDTACSSSMVALHQSVQSLRAGESRVAVAGGTELLLGPEQFVGESKMGLLSATGQSRMWDNDANGYARGDGVAALVLKRLSDAIADNDHIECLIRETGVNQDGNSTGLTVPSAEAQAALIKTTYARAGLDLSDPLDWPQFFEAHGTGTKVGDPREARAISTCFGGPQAGNRDHPLYVGSIKTIIGHTEGTAGLAGVLKACQALQNGLIPPNLLLNHLNPEVEQYCRHMQVPTSLLPWPALHEGVPRRASVNSFGFGGTNAHVILEAYQPPLPVERVPRPLPALGNPTPFAATFVFSAASDASLARLLQAYSDYLDADDTADIDSLKWTLQSRRSALRMKIAFSASTTRGLRSKIDARLQQIKQTPGEIIGVRSVPSSPSASKPPILGVFTGQGAQWATMGSLLVQSSAAVRDKLSELDRSLAALPEADRPTWTIADQLCATKAASRLSEAALAQPLCTALQVVLVDMLRSAGVTFTAVVGHSSGEIGAAYAAGLVSAHDAIRIAYYRGVHAKRAAGGAMLAVGTSWEDAEELISLPAFHGRLQIAAHNSAASLTLSGDAEAVSHAKRVFDEEKKFARLLLVDTAYHSHHMQVCSEPYVASLGACDIQVLEPDAALGPCAWYSSVRGGERMGIDASLRDTYWRDNMVQSVLFADAVKSAAAAEQVQLIVEVGPHPALKGPAQQTISDVISSPLPYTGVLSRGNDDAEAFADALGFLWTHLGPGAVDFQSFEGFVSSTTKTDAPQLLTQLPSYPWDHGKPYWHESRKAKKIRLRGAAFHELLGVPSPDNTPLNLRWTNFLRSDEIPWLDGHQLQGQTVFPAAGYVAMALEAARILAGPRSVRVFQVEDLVIAKAIAFDQVANFAVETLVTLTAAHSSSSSATQIADFAVYACPNTGTGEMELVSNGLVRIVYGTPSFSTLSASPTDNSNMVGVDSDEFYSTLHGLGYGYNGPFKTLSSTKRKLGQASALVSTYCDEEDDHPSGLDGPSLMVHPTMLDVAFQACFLAHTSPGDEHLWSLHVPTSIRCVRVNPELCSALPLSAAVQLPLSAALHAAEPMALRGNIDVFSEDGGETMLQVQDLIMKPFSPATAEDDRPMFSTTHYGLLSPSGDAAADHQAPSPAEVDLAVLCERVAYYNLRKLASEMAAAGDRLSSSEENLMAPLHGTVMDLLSAIDQGQHPSVDKIAWAADDGDVIQALVNSHPTSADMQLLTAMGERVARAVHGDPNDLKALQETGNKIVASVFSNGLGFAAANASLGRMLRQITFRYPHANIIEIGATGAGATEKILGQMGGAFGSYTCTCISEEDVVLAGERLQSIVQGRVSCTRFDPNKTPSSQGLSERGFDVVVASGALRAHRSPQEMLQNARLLLRPGGYVLLAVLFDSKPPLRTQILGALLGGQQHSMAAWNGALRRAGFSGIDTMTPPIDTKTWPLTVVAAQALDPRLEFLRAPSLSALPTQLGQLVVLGNQTMKTWRMVDEIVVLARRSFTDVVVLGDLPTDGDDDQIAAGATFINLLDIDASIFGQLTEARIKGLQNLFELANNLVWVTEGARVDEPYHNASIGFGRCIANEMPHLSLQFLDLEKGCEDVAGRLVADAALRLAALSTWDTNGTMHREMLWSQEPELYLEEGKLVVPRLLPDNERNARLNSLRRPVSKTVDLRSSTVCISWQDAGMSPPVLLEEEAWMHNVHSSTSLLQVSHSSLSALSIAPLTSTFLFLSLAIDQETGRSVVSLNDTSASSVAVPVASITPQGLSHQNPAVLLAATAGELLAAAILAQIPPQSRLLVNEPGTDGVLAAALTSQGAARQVDVLFSKAGECGGQAGWVQLDPWTSAQDARARLLPAKLTHFIDLAVDLASETSSLIRASLPATCGVISTMDVVRPYSTLSTETTDRGLVLVALQDAINRAAAQAMTPQFESIAAALCGSDTSIVRASMVGTASLPYPAASTTLVDWTADDALAVQVRPIDSSRLFSKNKTYLLVGLSGELGRSICEWMSRQGAGCVCLTSRTPRPDETWQAKMARAGTTVKLFAMDVTNKDDLVRVVSEIQATCPPIAGVANGAALFRDTLFTDMTVERMHQVTRPKIEGTRYLDELFFDTQLDFFLVFSSLMSTLGNPSQTNYVAGNAYMTGIVAQRRRRGLAATSLEIGRIAGIGYVERAGDVAREQLIRLGCLAISESDVHHLLAEAICAGRHGGNDEPHTSSHVLTTGCRTVHEDEESRVPWFDDPRLSHKVLLETQRTGGSANAAGGKKSSMPIRDQLSTATTTNEALEMLQVSFAAKVALISRLDGPADVAVPLIELGIDSLVAVEVRSWFLKELKTDVPVLKVLGGNSVADLCQFVLDKMPGSLLPKLGETAKDAEPKAAPAPRQPKSGRPAPNIEFPAGTESALSSSSSDQSTPHNSSPTGTPATPSTPILSRMDDASFKPPSGGSEGVVTISYTRTEPISFQQSRFWFLEKLIDDPTTFNVTFYWSLNGPLRIGDLERAVRLVVDRHESLRTAFLAADDNDEAQAGSPARQMVMRHSLVRLERKAIEHVEDVQVEYAAMKVVPFDLGSGKLLRMLLLTLSPTQHFLLFNYHHILMDGVSFQNFMADLDKAYQRQPLGPTPAQVPDLSCRQRAASENGGYQSEIAYWRRELPSNLPVLPLLAPARLNVRMPMRAYHVHQVEGRLSAECVATIRRVAKQFQSTAFHVYLTVFKTMLFRFAPDIDALTIGIADANRNEADAAGTVGLLLNLLTLYFERKHSGQTFGDAVMEARTKAYAALANSNVPFDVLLTELNVTRSWAHSPFFQAFLDYRQGAQDKMKLGNAGVELELLELHPGRTAYDMTLDITDGPDSAKVLFRTQASLYDATSAQLFLDTYVHLLETFIGDPALDLSNPPLFSNNQLVRGIETGRGPRMESSWSGGTLPHRIDQVAAENKDQVAIKDGHGRALTYTAMQDRIEAIAEAMQAAGVRRADRVLVFQDATADWPCSMLAIMRLGAVYVPLDLRNPLPRLADVAKSCCPAAILVDSSTVANAPLVNVSGEACIVDVSAIHAAPQSGRIANAARAADVAAILFTSGSTGKPKGIVVTHSGLRNEIEGYTKQWGLGAERVLQQSAFTFNHSSDQMYTGLVNGGFVYIVPWSKRGDPVEVTALLCDECITYTKATPAEYLLWMEYGDVERASSWRFAFGGGEPLNDVVIQRLASLNLPDLRFFNSYGPTEISISSTKMEVAYREPPPPEGLGRVPCGFSLPNYTAYILDEQRLPLPAGMPGQLWIGGAGVSLGYLDNEQLTAEHFVQDPYAQPGDIAQGWTRMYRTGDIAHLQENGAMVFHSRVAGDTQVKIRGLRIELADIESNIVAAADGALNEAVVTVRDGDLLVAHVVFSPHHLGEQISDPDAFLAKLLLNLPVPQYMVPAVAIPLERMPLNNHSKTDRRALKELPILRSAEQPQSMESGEHLELPLTETMSRLGQIWSDILKIDELLGRAILPSTSFFSVGGNSLLAVRLQARIRQDLCVAVRLVDLFEANTLADMARLVETNASVTEIDWALETALPMQLLPESATPLKMTNRVILVTGAGGFLGKHILEQLIADPTIAKVICIGLRDKRPNDTETPALPGSRRLADITDTSSKLITFSGDLTANDTLGLPTPADFLKLAEEVDAILHMAASRAFWDNYHVLRAGNVEPTRVLVRLASARRIPIHYVSTAGVLPAGSSGASESAAAHRPALDGAGGYVATRWVCEQILERAAAALAIPVTIHRFVPPPPPVLALHDESEVVAAALDHIVSFVDKMQTIPDCTGVTGQFDMMPVRDAAMCLAGALVVRGSDEGRSGLATFVGHECTVRIDVAHMASFVEARAAAGVEALDTLPVLRFFGRMKVLGLGYFVASQDLRMSGAGDGGGGAGDGDEHTAASGLNSRR